MNTAGALFEELLKIVAKLRDPNGGCPWDLKQTHQSLKPYLIEESYEVLDAIDELEGLPAASASKLPEELGDVLLQVALHSQVAKDSGTFSIDDIIKKLNEKLVFRHPHVFGDAEAKDADAAVKNWERMKAQNRAPSGSLLEGIPKGLPSLLRAHRIGEKVARVGFDWNDTAEVKAKVVEELKEFLETFEPGQKPEAMADELGDLFFSLAQLTRKLGLNAEDVLNGANAKFSKRFKAMEQETQHGLDKLSRPQLEALWQKVKNA
jgi:MazG family protein